MFYTLTKKCNDVFAHLGELCNRAVNEYPSVFLVPFDWVKVAAVFPVDGAGQGHLATITGLDLLSYHTCNQQMKVNNKYMKLMESITGKSRRFEWNILFVSPYCFPGKIWSDLILRHFLEKALLQGWNISSDWNLFDVVLCTLSTNILLFNIGNVPLNQSHLNLALMTSLPGVYLLLGYRYSVVCIIV